MAVALDPLTKTILDAPIGFVQQTITEILKLPVHLDVVEQNLTSGTGYIRKIVIMSGRFSIIRATTRFDSKILPTYIMSEMLQKKDGIGTILRKYHIVAQRRSVVINVESDGKKITRDYEVLCNGSVWFQISEEIQLDVINACQNR